MNMSDALSFRFGQWVELPFISMVAADLYNDLHGLVYASWMVIIGFTWHFELCKFGRSVGYGVQQTQIHGFFFFFLGIEWDKLTKIWVLNIKSEGKREFQIVQINIVKLLYNFNLCKICTKNIVRIHISTVYSLGERVRAPIAY